jgi:hypothetical protein
MTPYDQYRIGEFLHWYPAIQQHRMMDEWLIDSQLGTWTHTGFITAAERTVITPNPDVSYGYSWFNVSNGPMVIEIPHYHRYVSLSVFDMMHFIPAVLVAPTKPIVVRLANQTSPIKDAHEVVINTVSGVLFLRTAIPSPSEEPEVLAFADQIRTTGGDGDLPFIVPDFTEDERRVGLELIQEYVLRQTSASKVFGAPEQGVGDLDRCAGVFAGQLGVPASSIEYCQFVQLDGEPVGGDGSYRLTFRSDGMVRDDLGYWSVTVYDMSDRFLIPDPDHRYGVNSYVARPDADGTYTVRINRDGSGLNAIPTHGRTIYAVLRVYQPGRAIRWPTLVAD